MTSLSCQNLSKDCADQLSAEDSIEIQKVFLAHVKAKHAQTWTQYSQQFKSVAIVRVRDRFGVAASAVLTLAVPVPVVLGSV